MEFPATLASTHFLKLELLDSESKLLSSNFYWLAQPGYPDVMTDLNKMASVQLDMHADSKEKDGTRILTVTLHNPTGSIALMTHLQLRRKGSGGTRAARLLQRQLHLADSE